ncbi:N-acyl homoserine lactonase family protein [Mycobacterium yunnanensis]|uniref:N-acyl homoserine lactonase family protein n=1 Tax=Mycobacterium yunnanensis TaxID=368477 RepID=A0A9X2YWM1_9MYCO|nr:N-acyl homoserine lactonase family protein [Mycobacterium yunnanensis]MCV7419066.1 N-acyl homoserine lactonase family protein [Mycobacterium yunnanensis]
MTVDALVPLTCGWLTLPTAFFIVGEPDELTVPVPAYLIDHPNGRVLFDAGLGPRFRRPTGTPVEGWVDLESDACVDERLRALGVDPTSIRYLVNSHLHSDHAGGNTFVPDATVVVQRAEWDFAHVSDDFAYHTPEFDTGQDVMLVEGHFDLFGDGSVRLIPTPGHTPGHQSALVRTPTGDVVLTGDACNLKQSMDEMRLPDHAHDDALYRQSLQTLRSLRDQGASVFYGHDPVFWATLNPSSEAG